MAKRQTDVFHKVVASPIDGTCCEPACTKPIRVGQRVVSVVVRKRYSWRKPKESYRCVGCSRAFLAQIKKKQGPVRRKQ